MMNYISLRVFTFLKCNIFIYEIRRIYVQSCMNLCKNIIKLTVLLYQIAFVFLRLIVRSILNKFFLQY